MPKSVPGNFIPSVTNTPLDARQTIEHLSDVPNIENPFIGGIFCCIDTEKYYIITSLKSKSIGPLIVQNAQIDEYKEIVDRTYFEENTIMMTDFGSEEYPEPSEWPH